VAGCWPPGSDETARLVAAKDGLEKGREEDRK